MCFVSSPLDVSIDTDMQVKSRWVSCWWPDSKYFLLLQTTLTSLDSDIVWYGHHTANYEVQLLVLTCDWLQVMMQPVCLLYKFSLAVYLESHWLLMGFKRVWIFLIFFFFTFIDLIFFPDQMSHTFNPTNITLSHLQ